MRDPVFDERTPIPSRVAGAIALVFGGAGSVLVAVSSIDVAHYLRFAAEAAHWTGRHHRMSTMPLGPIASCVVVATLLASAVLAGRKRASPGSVVPALAALALALLATTVHALARLRTLASADHFASALDTFGPLAAATTLAPLALALALAWQLRALPSRLAPGAVVLPVLAAGVVIATGMLALDHGDLTSADATESARFLGELASTRRMVGVYALPCLALVPWTRLRVSVAVAATAWLALGLGLFSITRPFADDASGSPPRVVCRHEEIPPPRIWQTRTRGTLSRSSHCALVDASDGSASLGVSGYVAPGKAVR